MYYIPTELIYPKPFREYISVALRQGQKSFLAQGEPGTGKTSVGLAWASQAVANGGWSVFAQATPWLSDENSVRGVDLAGFVEHNPDRVYTPGFLMKALNSQAAAPGRPGVIVIDEWDKARPAADSLLLAALQERQVVDSSGNVWGSIAPNIIFWITSNATRELHPALRRRCLVVNFPALAGPELRAELVKAGAGRHLAFLLDKVAGEARKARRPIALSELQRVAAIAPRLSTKLAVAHLVDGLPSPRTNLAGDIWAAIARDR